MILLDTDTFSLLVLGHSKILERLHSAEDELGITIITRIEILRGRFDSVLKASDASQIQIAQERLEQSERHLAEITVVPIDDVAARAFERLLQNKKLKKIGRADLLIASIALARRATLVTRNRKHFQQVSGLHLENWAS